MVRVHVVIGFREWSTLMVRPPIQLPAPKCFGVPVAVFLSFKTSGVCRLWAGPRHDARSPPRMLGEARRACLEASGARGKAVGASRRGLEKTVEDLCPRL